MERIDIAAIAIIATIVITLAVVVSEAVKIIAYINAV